MANEEAMTGMSPTEKLDQESEDSAKGLSKTFKLIIAGMGGLTIHGLLAYYLARSFVIPAYFSSSPDTAVAIQEPIAKSVEPLPTPTSTQTADNIESEGKSHTKFFSVKHIVINPYGTNGRRFLAMDMSIGVNNKSVINELTEKDAQLRDKLNTLLSRKTVAELTNIVSKRKIKRDIRSLLNKMLDNGEVSEIYFTKYVLQ